MSATSESSQRHTLRLQRCTRIHGGIVATLWTLAVTWIVTDPLTGTHSGPTQRWMENTALLLVSAASVTLIAWLMQNLDAQPRNTVDRSFELGYYAGHADAQSESRPSFSVVSFPSSTGKTGT